MSGTGFKRSKPNPAELTTTGKAGALEEEQPKVGPEGAKRAGASESKDTESTEGEGMIRKRMGLLYQ